MTEVAKRPRGRPKGSKNKNRIISGATVEHYCQIHSHNPTKFIIDVAKGKGTSYFEPTHEDIYRANVKLHDSIHNAKAIAREQLDDDEPSQYEIVYLETPGESVPGEADAGGAAEAVRAEPL